MTNDSAAQAVKDVCQFCDTEADSIVTALKVSRSSSALPLPFISNVQTVLKCLKENDVGTLPKADKTPQNRCLHCRWQLHQSSAHFPTWSWPSLETVTLRSSAVVPLRGTSQLSITRSLTFAKSQPKNLLLFFNQFYSSLPCPLNTDNSQNIENSMLKLQMCLRNKHLKGV